MKTKTALLVACLVLAIALILSWAVPITRALEPRDWDAADRSSAPWSVEKGIEYLELARDSHQYYANHPDKCNKTTGSSEYNRKHVSEYQQIINLLRRLAEESQQPNPAHSTPSNGGEATTE